MANNDYIKKWIYYVSALVAAGIIIASITGGIRHVMDEEKHDGLDVVVECVERIDARLDRIEARLDELE